MAAVNELIEVLDRFTQSSDDALGACAIPDPASIESALEIRHVALVRVQELLPHLPRKLPVALRNRLAAIVHADCDLQAALGQAVDRIREQVGALAAQASRVDGYASAMPRVRRLDATR